MKKPPAPPETSSFEIEAVMRILEDQAAMKVLHEANSEYLPWSKFKYKDFPKGYNTINLWATAKLMRRMNQVPLTLGKDLIVQCSYSLTERMHQKLHEFDMNIGGNMSGGSIIPSGDKDRYLVSSIMEEAIASSQLEGAVTTRKVAKEMLLQERKPANKSEKMILNNYVTIQKILEWKDRKITKSAIQELHQLVTKDTLEEAGYEGKFRGNNEVRVIDNQTNEILHVPPKFETIDGLMESFCQMANDQKKSPFIHPIIKASILHFFIGYIHPFVDGNGRTARAIFYWYLIKNGYWLMEYMSISSVIKRAPVQYAKAYLETEQDGNDLTYFLGYMLRTMDLAFRNLQDYINRKVKEKRELYDLATIDEINERQAHIIKLYLDDPRVLLTIKKVKNTFNIVYQTARTDLLGLFERGLLQKKIVGKKKAVFYRSKQFQKILQRLISSK